MMTEETRNTTTNATAFREPGDNQRPVGSSLRISITAAYCVIFIFSMIGNGIIVYIVSTRSSLKSVTNCLIANMATADLVTTLVAMPYSVLHVFNGSHWIGGSPGNITCKLVHFLVALSVAVSVVTLTVIALDRFYAIVYPLKRGMKVRRRIRVAQLTIWSLSAIVVSPYLYFYNVEELTDSNTHCVVKWEPLADSFESSRNYFLFIFTTLYGIPLAIITALYAIVCRKLWLRKIPGNPSIIARRNASLSKRRTIKILVVLVVAFALCWLPAHTMHYYIFYQHSLYKTFSPYLVFFAFWISHVNSCVNPFLYITLNKNFRRACLDVLRPNPFRDNVPVGIHAATSMNYLTVDISLKKRHVRSLKRGRGSYKPSEQQTRRCINSLGVDLLSVAQPVTSSESSL